MNREQTLNFVGECVKSTTQFTQSTYYNICKGNEIIAIVPHGFWDYTVCIGLSVFCLSLVSVFFFIIIDTIRL